MRSEQPLCNPVYRVLGQSSLNPVTIIGVSFMAGVKQAARTPEYTAAPMVDLGDVGLMGAELAETFARLLGPDDGARRGGPGGRHRPPANPAFLIRSNEGGATPAIRRPPVLGCVVRAHRG